MRTLFDTAILVVLGWLAFGLADLYIGTDVPVEPIDEVVHSISDVSTGLENSNSDIQNLRVSIEALQQSLDGLKSEVAAKQSVLSGCDNAVTKLVEKDVRNENRFSRIEDSIAKLKAVIAEPPTLPPAPPKVETTTPKPEVELSAYARAVQNAIDTNRKVLFVLSRTGCAYCVDLDRDVISRPEFQEQIKARYVLTPINVSEDLVSGSQFSVSAFPAALVYDPKTNQWNSIGVPIITNGMRYISPPRNVSAFVSLLK